MQPPVAKLRPAVNGCLRLGFSVILCSCDFVDFASCIFVD
jgi:hypothetical protein